ncbi:hypothetical protein [Sphingomonas sp. SRS2]|uniref:hypothetical protein n=1 Tax=Sphingomonas sp. SRS2 TaxID=133190 RepID=UPI00128DDBBD|nr:hypothetical protein [Sphingomonas sp. SRS2]
MPIATTRFAGTGLIEGDSDVEGRLKRRSWGACWNVECRVLLAAHNIYEVGDPAHKLQAISTVKDIGRAASSVVVVNWQGSIAATLTALIAAAAPQGGAAIAPSIACIKWWTQPILLTADILGEIGSGYVDQPAAIAEQLAAIGGVSVSNAAAMIAARPDDAGLHIGTETETIASAIDRVLLGASLNWHLGKDGVVTIREWSFDPAPVASLRSVQVSRSATYPPMKSRRVGYRRNERLHSAAEISAVVLAADVRYADGQTGQDLQPYEPGATDGAVLDPTAEHGALVDANGFPIFPSELLNTAVSLSPDGRLIAAIEQIGGGIDQVELGRLSLPDMGVATAAQKMQLDSAILKLSEAVARLATGQARANAIFRDAGLYTDAASGLTKLFAIESRAEQITNLSVTLNAAISSINLKASVDYVNTAIATAVLDPSQIANFDAILVRLTSAEVDIDGLQASVLLKADATTVTTLSGTVVSVQSALSALTGTVASKADSTTVNAIDVRLASAESTLTALGDTASISQAVTASRRLPQITDLSAMNMLAALAQGDIAARSLQVSIAQARQELTARIISDVAAEAIARLQLGVEIGTVAAAVQTEQTARVDGDTALASSLATYQAETASSLATVNTAVNAVTDAQSATASSLTAFQASTGASLASITNTNIAQTNSLNTIAGSVNTLSTTVGGHTASITSHSSSINGLSVRIGVETDVNGYVTGWVFNNSGLGRSDFLMRVDRFGIASPGNPTLVPFEIVGGVAYMKKAVIRNLSVETIKIAGNAVTDRRFAQMVGTRSGAGAGVWQTVCSETITLASEADVVLQASGQHAYFAGTQPWQWRFLVNGGQVLIRGGDGGVSDLPCMNGNHVSSAGSNTYALQCWMTNGNLQLTSANLIIDPAYK